MVLLKRIFVLPLIVLAACNSGSGPSTTGGTDTEDTTTAKSSEPVASAGQQMFQTNCQSCHQIETRQIGPPLKDVEKKWKSRQDLIDYIHNPAAYIASGKDQRIVDLHKEYGLTMPAFSYLKEPEIDSILNYIAGAPSK